MKAFVLAKAQALLGENYCQQGKSENTGV